MNHENSPGQDEVGELFIGKFLLSYAPKMKPRHEFMTVTPDGIRFRQQIHHSLNACINWFKEHFRVGFYDAYVVPEELFCSRLYYCSILCDNTLVY